MISLRYEGKEYVLNEDIPFVDDNVYPEDLVAHNKHDEQSTKVVCIMLAIMSPEIQKSFENYGVFEINEHLKEMFQVQAWQERFEIVKSLMACKHQDANSMCARI